MYIHISIHPSCSFLCFLCINHITKSIFCVSFLFFLDFLILWQISVVNVRKKSFSLLCGFCSIFFFRRKGDRFCTFIFLCSYLSVLYIGLEKKTSKYSDTSFVKIEVSSRNSIKNKDRLKDMLVKSNRFVNKH